MKSMLHTLYQNIFLILLILYTHIQLVHVLKAALYPNATSFLQLDFVSSDIALPLILPITNNQSMAS